MRFREYLSIFSHKGKFVVLDQSFANVLQLPISVHSMIQYLLNAFYMPNSFLRAQDCQSPLTKDHQEHTHLSWVKLGLFLHATRKNIHQEEQ